jgi:subtilisin family serine protease
MVDHPNLGLNIPDLPRIHLALPRNADPRNSDYVDDHDVTDDFGHGTHVAGIVGAVGRAPISGVPALPMVGVNWGATIIPVRFLDKDGVAPFDDAVRAVARVCSDVVDDPARPAQKLVVNLSWAASNPPAEIMEGLKFIMQRYTNRVLFVAAAGNTPGGSDNEVTPVYPANFSDLPNLISVMAVDRCDNVPQYSNYSKRFVDIAAPGGRGDPNIPQEDIFSTAIKKNDLEYAWMAGTSMAAAYVSGAAAFVWMNEPNLSPGEVKQSLVQNGRLVPGLSGFCKSGKVLDLAFLAPVGSVLPRLPSELNCPPLSPTATPIAGTRFPTEGLDLGYSQPWAFTPPASSSPFVPTYFPSWPPPVIATQFAFPPFYRLDAAVTPATGNPDCFALPFRR